jgi:8-oxo-dGTP pyrophosphatase MutT (NUDIX family)
MHLTDDVLAPIRGRYGEPTRLEWRGEITEPELRLITHNSSRRHDVTLFIFNGDKLALIRKPHFAHDIWRPPGGGIKPGEDFEAGVLREALEETGVHVELDRYLVLAEPVFLFANEAVPWQTHLFSATTSDEVLDPSDTQEIAEARWGTLDELAGPLRERLLATWRAFWRYRVALHDAAIAALRA